ncbi:DMT family transporter [Kitasatospora nipponensis]|uniref:DMT family transporter n=1 Tax=Kitasatospora nipponensis TaxID=258049 RepID=A0ABP4H3U1_9ACTN
MLAAASNALAVALQRRAALTVPASEGFRLRLMIDLLHRPVWLAGFAAVLCAAACQALALATGPISVVQPIFILELPFALLAAGLILGRRLGARIWSAVALVVVGLGTALAAASPTPGTSVPPLALWIPAVLACGGAVALLVGAALRRPNGPVRAAAVGTAVAVGYALTAALLKDAAHAGSQGGAAAFFTAWQTYGFAAVGVGALFLLQNALHSGPLVASQPALTLGDASVSLALGVTLFGERIRLGWWLVPEILGVALIVTGVVRLAASPLTGSVVAPPSPDAPVVGSP